MYFALSETSREKARSLRRPPDADKASNDIAVSNFEDILKYEFGKFIDADPDGYVRALKLSSKDEIHKICRELLEE